MQKKQEISEKSVLRASESENVCASKCGDEGTNECEKHATPAPTNERNVCVCVFPHVSAPSAPTAPPAYAGPQHYPERELAALKLDQDLDRSPPKQPKIETAAEPESESEQEEKKKAKTEKRPRQPVKRKMTAKRARPVQIESEEDTEDDAIYDTPNDEQTSNAKKQMVLRSKVKSEPHSFTVPMVEVAGTDGAMMVHRPWNGTDLKECMAGLPNPEDAGDRFAGELIKFCQEFSPTTQELKRLVGMKLGAAKWQMVVSARTRASSKKENKACLQSSTQSANQTNNINHRKRV
ncbi:hypothetical protein PO909_024985 [Leuciscus waleckii]